MKTGKRAGAEGETPSASGRSGTHQPISVSQLAARIDSALKSSIRGRVVVAGEISSLTQRTHWYFSLKDANAVVGAVVFASVARKVSYTPKHGDSVIATGRLEFYAPSGRVSLIIETMVLAGQGELEQRYRAMCDELRAMGWFDPATKQLIPSFPKRVAVITSRSGAALQDVIDTMSKRCPAVGLLVVDARVQGANAAPQIARAVRTLNARRGELGVDAILITRGGGSLEDLWAFNDRGVAQAIHDSRLPVVAAIGHETDTTIAELAADERCATPTQAAMKLAPDRDALREQLSSIEHRLRGGVLSTLRYERQRLTSLSRSRALASQALIIENQRDRIAALRLAVVHAIRVRHANARRRLDRATVNLARHQPAAVHARRAEHLNGLDHLLLRAIQTKVCRLGDALAAADRELHAIGPIQVLARGYSVTIDAKGRLVRRVGDAGAGETIFTRVADGAIRSKVIGQKEGAKKASKRAGSKPGDPPQMDLF